MTQRRLTFDDIALGRPSQILPHLVPLERAGPGDRQVAVAAARGEGVAGTPFTPVSLDRLGDLPDVESVVGSGRVVATRPLPAIRELSVTEVDEETLANLPGLRMLDVRSGPDRRPLDPLAVAPGLRDLRCDARRTFPELDALARFGDLERLALAWSYEHSLKPLAGLRALRWLIADSGKDLRSLGGLERLELVHLKLESGSLANLKAFRPWRRLRRLEIEGRRLKSLNGIEALDSLRWLRLYLPAIKELAPLRGHPALLDLELHHADSIERWEPLELPALRRLTVELESPRRLPTLGFLRGCPALEEVTLIGEGAQDRDLSPLLELPSLRRLSFYGDYRRDDVEALREARPAAKVDWQPPF